jgi:hypothetical protein
MAWFAIICEGVIELFVPDESFVAGLLAWLVGGWICLQIFHVDPIAEGILLAAGFVLLLAENVERTAREFRR